MPQTQAPDAASHTGGLYLYRSEWLHGEAGAEREGGMECAFIA